MGGAFSGGQPLAALLACYGRVMPKSEPDGAWYARQFRQLGDRFRRREAWLANFDLSGASVEQLPDVKVGAMVDEWVWCWEEWGAWCDALAAMCFRGRVECIDITLEANHTNGGAHAPASASVRVMFSA
jgi:hypothetical protein